MEWLPSNCPPLGWWCLPATPFFNVDKGDVIVYIDVMETENTFVRTQRQKAQLMSEALGGKDVIKDATIDIVYSYEHNKLKAKCNQTGTYLQFPNNLRIRGARYTADVIEVKNEKVDQKYYRVLKNTIRNTQGNIVG